MIGNIKVNKLPSNNNKNMILNLFLYGFKYFKTYLIVDDIYTLIIDKELLFQFVDGLSINRYYNSIKINDLSKEELLLYELYEK